MKLVHIKGNDIFTDSLVIAEGTRNQHESIKRMISTYENKFLELNTFPISNRESHTLSFSKRQSIGGRPEEIIELNEPQASFLITLLRNNDVVVTFKLALVKEFYRMRQFLLRQSSAEWQEVRQKSKTNRLHETDEIKRFVAYCKENGSSNANNYYTTITKLVNKAVGLESEQRDTASYETLQLISILENTIRCSIAEELEKQTEYHQIYFICKHKVASIMKFVYLPEQKLLLV